MSTTIDQQVVEMRFDNKNFENNVSTTMSTLDKLKEKLKFPGASKGLEEVSASAKKVDMSPLGNAVETVGLKFNAMYTIADQVLRNITNSAMVAGKRMASALTIDPIKTGFSEYETQINSVQTILANTESKGTTLNDVNSALDTLNSYADKTIYNFTEMTRNIGTFTAAGVDLDTSVNAIQGIANLAAVSGSNSQQASTAMYQLSQALSSGTVKLMDWNSVVNAGMGGQVFQDALKETARVHGIAIDDMIKEQGSFRETLSEGWLTSEILTDTLQKFTMGTEGLTEAQIEQNRQMLRAKGYTDEQIEGIFKLGNTATNAATKVKTFTQLWDTLKEAAQSGWTQTWEIIVGDFEEAKELMTGISDFVGGVINKSSESRNNLLSGALDNNWEKMIGKINEAGIESNKFDEILRKTMESHGLNVDALIEEHGSLAKAFRSGAVSSDILKEAVGSLNKSLVDLSDVEGTFKKGSKGDDVKKIQEALVGLGHDVGKAGADGIFGKDTEEAIKAFQELKGLEVTGIVDEKTLKALKEAGESTVDLTESCGDLIDAITELGGREKLIEGLKNVFKGLINIVKPIGEAFREIFPPTTVEQVTNFIDKFVELTERFRTFTENNAGKIKTTFTGIFSVLDIGWTILKQLGGAIIDLLGRFKGLGGGVLGVTSTIGEWLIKLRTTVKETNIFGLIIDKVFGFIGKIIDKFKEFKDAMTDSFDSSPASGFLGILLSIWEGAKKIGGIIANVFSSMATKISRVFSGDTNVFNIINSGLFAGILAGIAGFTNKLAGLVDDVGDVVENFGGVFESIGDVIGAYQNQLNSKALKNLAIAIALLAGSMLLISMIDPEALDRSLGAIGILFAELVGALALFGKINSKMKGAVKAIPLIVAMSVGVLILASALKKLSSLSWGQLLKGIVGVGALMLELMLFLKFAKFDRKMKGTATGIVILSAAMLILAKAVENFGNMDTSVLIQGLIAVGVLLGELALFTRLTGNAKHVISTGLSMVLLGAALKILASAVSDFANIGTDGLVTGLVGMGAALLIVAGAMHLMPKNAILIGAGLVVVAAAMKLMVGVIKDFNGVGVDGLIVGILGMGAALLTLALSLQVMKGTLGGAASLLVAAAALAILVPLIKTLGSMSIGSIVQGILTLAAAIAVIGLAALILKPLIPTILSLSVAFALFGIAVAAVGVGVLAFSAGLTALAASGTAAATAIVAMLGILIVGIIALIPEIITLVEEIIVMLCDALVQCAPKIVESALIIIFEVLKALVQYTPEIVTLLFDFVIGVLNATAEKLPELISAAVNLLMAFFQGIIDAIRGIDVSTLVAGLAGVGLFSAILIALSAVASLVPGAMVGVLAVGALIVELALVLAAIGALSQIPGLNWLVEKGGDFLQAIGTAIGKFIGGIIGGIAQGFTSSLPQIGLDLSMFMVNVQPFIVGAKTIDESVMTGVGVLSAAILALTAADLINSISSFLSGGSSLAQLGTELSMFMVNATPFLMAARTIDPAIMEGVKALAETILILTAANVVEGLTSWFTGGNSLASFGEQLSGLGTHMNSFVTNLGTFDESKVTTVTCAANAIKALAEAAKTLPNEGGWAGKILGENSIATFGSYLPGLGTNLNAFATNLGTFDEAQVNTISCAANAIKVMAEAADAIPNEGGWVGKILGENSLATFGDSLAPLGTNLSAFAENLGTFDDSKVSTVGCAANAIKTIAQAADGIPNEGGWAAKIFGDNTLSTFSAHFGTLGTNLNAFATNLGTFGEDKVATVNSAVRAIKAFTGLANADLKGAEANIGGFGGKLPDLGTNITSFCTNMPAKETVDAAISSLKSVLSMISDISTNNGGISEEFSSSMKNLGNAGVNALVNSLKDGAEKVRTASGNMGTAIINGLSKKHNVIQTAGKTLVSKLIGGIDKKKKDVPKAFTSALTSAVTKIKDKYDSFYSAGSYLVDGFVDGIDENTYKAAAQAAAMAKAAKKAAEEALGVASPSKEFYKIGRFTVTGFVNALVDYSGKVYDAGSEMADSARKGMNSAINSVIDAINIDSDMQPTITPVLDLSDVQSGVGAISGMFKNNQSIGIDANLSAINSAMNSRIQNGTNNDVISAIDKLRGMIGNTGNTYIIDGITYDDGSNISDAVSSLMRAARIERRV